MTDLNEADRKKSFEVFEYEVQMYFETRVPFEVVRSSPLANPSINLLTNAVVESRILHTRQIVDILLSRGRRPDDIRLADLLPNPDTNMELKSLIQKLHTLYGTRSDVNSPCWTINKMLAHATTHRGISFNYSETLGRIEPTIDEILKLLSKRTRRPSLYPFQS